MGAWPLGPQMLSLYCHKPRELVLLHSFIADVTHEQQVVARLDHPCESHEQAAVNAHDWRGRRGKGRTRIGGGVNQRKLYLRMPCLEGEGEGTFGLGLLPASCLAPSPKFGIRPPSARQHSWRPPPSPGCNHQWPTPSAHHPSCLERCSPRASEYPQDPRQQSP